MALVLSAASAFAFESRAGRAYLYDLNSRTVLYAKNEDQPFAPASLAKIVTAATVQNMIENGELSADDTITISENAWRTGGAPSGRSTMFAELGSDVPISDLLKGLVVMAANDAAIALAEGIEGDERAFAARMNTVASDLGAENSFFTTASGNELALGEASSASEETMATTVRDMVTLATELIQDDPDTYALFQQTEFTWNGIFQRNKNPLMTAIEGADGLMAGFTEEAGYGIVGSVERNGRRVVFALSGVDTAEGRLDEARRLLRYAFDDFRTVQVAEQNEQVAKARVYGGSERSVALVAEGGTLDILLPREGEERVRARVVYNHPFPAPIEAGQPIARLIVERDGTIIQDTPLVAAQAVEKGSALQRARDGFFELLVGWLPPISLAGSL
ncbi:MAG: D-alanyl-D-alanine carboxypeptidase family protein [Pseudomonadota bacterium]